jgi:hypothetical protein
MRGDSKSAFLHSQNPGHKCFILLVCEHTLWPLLLDLVFSFKWFERDVTNMCQNLLSFLKDNCPLSIASITASNALDVHLPHYVKLKTMLTHVGFFACARTIGGMFSLFVDCWSCKLFRLLRSTMDIMVLIHCFLVLTSNKLGGPIWSYNRYIFEPHVWIPRL